MGTFRRCKFEIQIPRAARRVVPFWNAHMPPGTSIEIALGLSNAKGLNRKIPMARWSAATPGQGKWSSPGKKGARVQGSIRRKSFPNLRSRDYQRRVDTLYIRPGVGSITLELSLYAHGGRYPQLTLAGLTWAAKAVPRTDSGSTPKIGVDCPAYSQFEAPPELAPRLCSPACVAMALSSQLDKPVGLLRTAKGVYDGGPDLYGNWSFASAYAGELLHRTFRSGGAAPCFMAGWNDCLPILKRKIPVILSLKFKEGFLPGAPIRKSPGHLVLLRGFDGNGKALVCDPAEKSRAAVNRAYPAKALDRAWAASGRLAYVLIKGPVESLLPKRLGRLHPGPFF